MILTAFGDVSAKDYPAYRALGLNTVWRGDPRTCAAAGLGCVVHTDCVPHPAIAACYLGEDVPLQGLCAMQARAAHWRERHGGLPALATVAALYTRVLPSLGAPSCHEYLRAFAYLAPDVTPVLCCYPLRDPATDLACTADGWRGDYEDNLRLMAEVFGGNWWLWVQVTEHELYEWHLTAATAEQIALQVNAGQAHGASGFGFFQWEDFPLVGGWGYPGIRSDPAPLREALRTLALNGGQQ